MHVQWTGSNLTTVQVTKWSCFMNVSYESYNNEATVASKYKVPTNQP